MWLSLLAACVGMGLVAASYRQLLALRGLRERAAAELARPSLGGEDPRMRVADLNEATIDMRAGLAQAGQLQRSCAKVALAVGALAAIVQSAELLAGVQHAGQTESPLFFAPIASFVGGCVGALGCSWIGRAAEAQARRLRDDWGTLIERATRDVRN
jgi:hypothetical protein